MSDMPKGFSCTRCGTYHKFAGYVFAHWNEDVVHTCECGAKHDIFQGEVTAQ